MRILLAILIGLIVLVQYRIWVADDGVVDLWRLERAVAEQRTENTALAQRNAQLAAEVRDLKEGLDAVEARAREELGMIRKDETLYQFANR